MNNGEWYCYACGQTSDSSEGWEVIPCRYLDSEEEFELLVCPSCVARCQPQEAEDDCDVRTDNAVDEYTRIY